MSVRHAVIPAAGRGTRMLPVSRAVPKELLPLGHTPVIDFVVRELGAAGIGELVVVTAPDKRAILDHLAGIDVTLHAVEQPQPRGLGDAVLRAAAVVGGDPFVVALPDALVPDGAVRDLVSAVERGLDGAVLVESVPPEEAHRYGIAQTDAKGLVVGLVEKPAPGSAATRVAIAGRYVLPAAIFDALRATPPDARGEVQLTDALAALVAGGARIAAVPLRDCARRRDVGSPAGYIAAFVDHVLGDPALAPAAEHVLRARRLR